MGLGPVKRTYRRNLKSKKRAALYYKQNYNRTQSQLPSGNSDTVPRGMPYSNDGIVIERTFAGVRSQTGAGTTLFPYISILDGLSYSNYNAIFQLNDLPGFTDFVTVFGEYKILAAELIFTPVWNNFVASGSIGNSEQPVLMLATDVDGIQNNDTLDRQLQYASNRVCVAPQGEIRHKIRPKYYVSAQTGAAGITSNTSATTGYIALSSGSTGGSVDHFGVAIGLNTASATSDNYICYQVYTKLTVALRHVL